MGEAPQQSWRSKCPLNIALEILGDRWTLLILRDLMIKRLSTFKDFQESGEGIATNVLSDRLKLLRSHGIIASKRSKIDARIVSYSPTKKGLDLLPVMIEMIIWAANYEQTAATAKIMQRLIHERESFIAEIRTQFDVEAE